ncbi:hypothetical protein CCP3SC1_360016 [Gammaproteobacteria bacterium]
MVGMGGVPPWDQLKHSTNIWSINLHFRKEEYIFDPERIGIKLLFHLGRYRPFNFARGFL